MYFEFVCYELMETIGFWCDECRVKYVRHACKEQLPCGHPKVNAIRVYAKAFGRGGENVSVGSWSIFIGEEVNRKDICYLPGGSWLWQTKIEYGDTGTEMWLGEWLKSVPHAEVRAFFHRWDSAKTSPDWQELILNEPRYFEPESCS